MEIQIKKLSANAKLPKYQTIGAAGSDLYACIDKNMTIAPNEIVMVPTGLALAIPEGFEMQIRSRSGLASRYIVVPNSPGTIDSDYRGEIKILLLNLGKEIFVIEHGMRIAQSIISPVIQAKFALVEELPTTDRGSCGFGSTGLQY